MTPALRSWALGMALVPAAHLGAATFYVTAYGALGDGSTNDTAAIQAAINAAAVAGAGSQVLIPAAAGSYLSDPLTLASNITFTVQSGAMLQMEPMGAYQGGSSSPTYFLAGSNLTNVLVNGGGTLDGQGAAWWAAFIANSAVVRPPALLRFANCSNVTVSGIRIQNAPMIDQSFYNETNLLVSGETVFNPYASASNNISPNTDGMDVTGTNIRIENCNISTGDDVIALGTTNAATRNVTITGCVFGTGHGLSLGSHTAGGVSGLWVDHCTFTGTQYGIRFKSDRGDGGLCSDLHFSELTMTAIAYQPIFLTSYYGVSPAPALGSDDPGGPATLGSTTPQWQDVTFTDINAATASGARGTLQIWALPEAKATNFLFNNVSVTGPSGAILTHATGVSFTCTCRINGAPPSAANETTYDTDVTTLPCPADSPTPTCSATPSRTGTPSPSRTPSVMPSPTLTASPSPTGTPAASRGASPGPSPSGSATPASPSSSATATQAPTQLPSASETPAASVSPTASVSPASTASSTPAATATPTPTLWASATATLSPWLSATASSSPDGGMTGTATATFTATVTSTATATASATATPTASGTRSAGPTASASPGVGPAVSATPTASPQASATATTGPGGTATGGALTLVQAVAFPNPSTGGTVYLGYTLDGLEGPVASGKVLPPSPDAKVSLQIFSSAMVLVWHLDLSGDALAAGPHRVDWDARDSSGRALARGLYFYRIQLKAQGAVAGSKTVAWMLLR